MRVLFDQGVPLPLSHHLTGHTVALAAEVGWSRLTNGELLRAAELSGYEVLVTTDKNLRYQQNLQERIMAIVVISHAQWPALAPHVERVAQAVDAVRPGSYVEVEIPLARKRQPGL
jgi:hypothetical protein